MKATVSVLCALLCLPLAAQETRSTAPSNTISVAAEGEFESAPDTATLTFNLSAQEPTTQAAYDHASKAAEQMRQALRSAGVDPNSAQLARYSLEPVIDYRSAKQKVIAFRAGTTVNVKLKDFTKIGPLIEALAPIQETSGESVSYSLENIEAAKKSAITQAYQRARAYAESLASASGRKLGNLVEASIGIQEPGVIRPMMMKAQSMVVNGNAPPPTAEFQPEQIRVTANVSVQFALE